MSAQQQQPVKWAAYFEGDEFVHTYDSEGEAIGEMECRIDDEYEQGDEIEYCTATMVNGLDLLQRENAQRMGEMIWEQIDNDLADDMGAEESPVDLTQDDIRGLGQLVIDYIATHGKPQWWTVDQKTEKKRTYIAGSNDVQEGSAA